MKKGSGGYGRWGKYQINFPKVEPDDVVEIEKLSMKK